MYRIPLIFPTECKGKERFKFKNECFGTIMGGLQGEAWCCPPCGIFFCKPCMTSFIKSGHKKRDKEELIMKDEASRILKEIKSGTPLARLGIKHPAHACELSPVKVEEAADWVKHCAFEGILSGCKGSKPDKIMFACMICEISICSNCIKLPEKKFTVKTKLHAHPLRYIVFNKQVNW